MQSIRMFFDAAGVAKHVARHDETLDGPFST
jgi:hypothetical protein